MASIKGSEGLFGPFSLPGKYTVAGTLSADAGAEAGAGARTGTGTGAGGGGRSNTGVQEGLALQDLSTAKLAEILKKTKTSELPEQYQVQAEDRPSLSYDEWADLPVIDFSELYTNATGLAQKIGAACRDWGFFQLVNHNIPLDDISAFREQGEKFFGLPTEEKSKAVSDVFFCQYRSNHLDQGLGHTSLLWAESIAFKHYPVFNLDELIKKVWPQGNPDLRNAALNYAVGVEKLVAELWKLFALSLGLEKDYFGKHFTNTKDKASYIRCMNYPPCPQPSLALGIKPHTDPFMFTILQQDDIGGLQIKKDGAWFGVKPIKGAVLVNVGDLMQAWTNDIFKSVPHRVVVNKDHTRFSIAVFTGSLNHQLSLVPPPQLIDENHPPVYRPFTMKDFLRIKYKPKDESQRITIGHGLEVLDILKRTPSRL